MELVTPFALIYFAWRTDEVGRSQVRIAALQADIVDNQRKIEERQITPTLKIDYVETDRLEPANSDRIILSNSGGTMFETKIRIWSAVKITAYRKEFSVDTVSELTKYAFVKEEEEPPRLRGSSCITNLEIKKELPKVLNVSKLAQKLFSQKIYPGVPQKITRDRWKSYQEMGIILQIKYVDALGSKKEEDYFVNPSTIHYLSGSDAPLNGYFDPSNNEETEKRVESLVNREMFGLQGTEFPPPPHVPPPPSQPLTPYDLRVYFDYDSALLPAPAGPIIDSALSDIFERYELGDDPRVEVVGYTDTPDSSGRGNIALARAQVVGDALVKAGIPQGSLSIVAAVERVSAEKAPLRRYARIRILTKDRDGC